MPRPVILGILAHYTATAIQAVAALMRRQPHGDVGQMNDHMLRDIGLTRQDLWGGAAEPLFRDPGIRHTRPADDQRPAIRAGAYALGLNGARRLWAEENRIA